MHISHDQRLRLQAARSHVCPSFPPARPSPALLASPCCLLQESLTKVLLFNNLDPGAQRRVVREMYERPIAAGEILIQEGDTGGGL